MFKALRFKLDWENFIVLGSLTSQLASVGKFDTLITLRNWIHEILL